MKSIVRLVFPYLVSFLFVFSGGLYGAIKAGPAKVEKKGSVEVPKKIAGKKIQAVEPEWYARTPSFVIGNRVFSGADTCAYIDVYSAQLKSEYDVINAKQKVPAGSYNPDQFSVLKAYSDANTKCDQASDRLDWLEPTLNITYWGTWLSALSFIPSVLLWMAEVPEPAIFSAGLLTLTLLTQIVLGPWQDSVFDQIRQATELHNQNMVKPSSPTGTARVSNREELFYLGERFRF